MNDLKKGTRTLVLLLLGFCFLLGISCPVKASGTRDAFCYNKGDKLYTRSQIVKGKKHLTKSTYKKHDMTQYQIVKISKGKVTLRPQQGMYQSADPYFKKKTLTYKISSKCKFYYRDVTYPCIMKRSRVIYRYKQISKASILKYIKDPLYKGSYGNIYMEDYKLKKKYYTGGYFGDVYTKNGKIIAVITDAGD